MTDPSPEALDLARDWLEAQDEPYQLYDLVQTLRVPLARLVDAVAFAAASEARKETP